MNYSISSECMDAKYSQLYYCNKVNLDSWHVLITCNKTYKGSDSYKQISVGGKLTLIDTNQTYPWAGSILMNWSSKESPANLWLILGCVVGGVVILVLVVIILWRKCRRDRGRDVVYLLSVDNDHG